MLLILIIQSFHLIPSNFIRLVAKTTIPDPVIPVLILGSWKFKLWVIYKAFQKRFNFSIPVFSFPYSQVEACWAQLFIAV